MGITINSKILLSAAAIVVAAVLVVGATVAFFSDNETSTNNTLTAGAVDLKIDNTSYLNGVLQDGTEGTADTTWALNDLTEQLFFNFDDIKPGDLGEDTISLHSQNDCWLCASVSLTKNDDNTCTEPEKLVDPTCSEPDAPPDLTDGELAQNVNFVFWEDDGDNILEIDEDVLEELTGPAGTILNNNSIVLADKLKNNLGGVNGEPMTGGFVPDGPDEDSDPDPIIHYIGKAWCFGTLTQAPVADNGIGAQNPPPTTNLNGGVLCNGENLNNETQSDNLMADITFSAVQARNNPNFVCPSATPTPPPCGQADVMLVLDRSGSINPTELTQLKTAATAFVNSLGLTPTGINAGQTSFSTTGSLDQILTGSGASVDAAIAALSSGGFTNLKSGIDLATGELTGGNDRADGSSPDKMIIITDGHPNRPRPSGTADDVAKAAADAARAVGIEVFVVGVGSDVNTAFLQNDIANPGAGHYFSVADYSQLQTTLDNLDLCDQ